MTTLRIATHTTSALNVKSSAHFLAVLARAAHVLIYTAHRASRASSSARYVAWSF